MKNLFTYRLNKKENKVDSYFDNFIIRKTTEEQQEDIDKANNKESEINEKAALPKWLAIMQFILFLISIIFIGGVLKALSDTNINTVWKNGKYIIIIGVITSISYTIILIYSKIKFRKVKNSEELVDFEKEAENIINESLDILNIPIEAPMIDVFAELYLVKNGKDKKIDNLNKYNNLPFYVFEEGDNLCFADISTVIGIPIKNITTIRKIEKKVIISEWNKDDDYNSPKYKQYKIKTNNYGFIIKPYYELHFMIDDIEYFILIAPYDIDYILKLLELNVVE